MSWETLNINELPKEVMAEKTFEPVPKSRYTLQLLGASLNTYRPGAINVSTAITDSGEFTGRRIFLDLPNVDEHPWAAQVLARMIESMGAEMPAYSDPVAELNRIASNGHSRFSADVYIDTYVKKDGTEGRRNKVALKSISPAA